MVILFFLNLCFYENIFLFQFFKSLLRWSQFHLEWMDFEGQVLISCFETMRNNLTSEVGRWLDFMDLDHRRLGCVDYDPVGQFYRHKEIVKKCY